MLACEQLDWSDPDRQLVRRCVLRRHLRVRFRLAFSQRYPILISVFDCALCRCGLQSTGAVVCFGDDTQGQTSVPNGVVFLNIHSNVARSCGVTITQSVKCWGTGRFARSLARFLQFAACVFATALAKQHRRRRTATTRSAAVVSRTLVRFSPSYLRSHRAGFARLSARNGSTRVLWRQLAAAVESAGLLQLHFRRGWRFGDLRPDDWWRRYWLCVVPSSFLELVCSFRFVCRGQV